MRVFGITDRGAVRKENQDSFRFEAPRSGTLLTAVVCDGMGGVRGGRLASGLAADAFMSHAANSLDESSSPADMRDIVTEAVSFANTQVYERAFQELTNLGMGTTLVALLVSGRRALVANVGDSRAYLFARGKLRQLTTDHSLVQELVAQGQLTKEEARVHPRKNVITRAVGTEASVKADLTELRLVPGSRVLLCSDGLSNVVPEAELERVLREEKDPESACRTLLELALAAGAPDNVTALIAQHGTEDQHGQRQH